MNLKKHFIGMGIGVLLTTGLMFTLYAISPLTGAVVRGGFKRSFAPRYLPEQANEVDLRHNSFYIAGITPSHIYLGNPTRPLLVTVVDRKTLEQNKFSITISGIDSIAHPRYFRLKVINNSFYLSHGIKPCILRGTVGQWGAQPLNIESYDYFDQAVVIGPSSFGFRFYSTKVDGYAIAKKKAGNKPDYKFTFDFLQKQGDGAFSVDGNLHYSDSLNRLIYTYAYRNEYILADTNLNIVARGNTIDTTTHAKIRIAKIDKENTMMSAPAYTVNRNTTVFEKYLFVDSNLLSQVEDQMTFMTNSVIDVYNLETKSYLTSFYLRNTENKKASDLAVSGDIIAAIVGEKLIIYKLTDQLLQNKSEQKK